ncbi:membrane protein [Vibrio metoecus]|uniref:Z-ring associated protein G n=1 Tax=Vibrio metoecus TaxID=1481663 RepID=A0A0Q0T972_VIBMT|nr:membrane protein [Vibrio metoecus]
MPWIYAIAGLLVGIAVGMLIAPFDYPSNYKTQKNLQKELESAKFTIEQQRQELSDHFAQTAEMLDTLGKDYTKLYQHMAKTATDLIPNLPEQDNPFSKLAQQKESENKQPEELEQPPKDYALGATGLLRGEEKAIIRSADLVNAKAS